MTSASKIKYEGSCQCNEIAFEVNLLPLDSSESAVTDCNCSICTRNGYHIVYAPRSEVTWTRGWDNLNDFRFGQKRSDHKFCPQCGSSMVIDPCHVYKTSDMFKDAPDAIGLNVRRSWAWGLRSIEADIINRFVCSRVSI